MSHCNPQTASASGDVFAYGKGAHRNNDLRDCGAHTVVIGNSTVFVNGRLWAIAGDLCDHGSGDLINSGTSVLVEGTPVIVLEPDNAEPDMLCGGEA